MDQNQPKNNNIVRYVKSNHILPDKANQVNH